MDTDSIPITDLERIAIEGLMAQRKLIECEANLSFQRLRENHNKLDKSIAERLGMSLEDFISSYKVDTDRWVLVLTNPLSADPTINGTSQGIITE